ncbi:hypothetical protein [Micrococcus luteus]|uniref:hypothetical protein n=1 Tax=Micrococcus luteus TaxID=1270 RepID=UPI002304A19A|nr:hypothetical protein [Micrococcus luteus]
MPTAPTAPAAVFTVRHRKALTELFTASLTHAQLDALTAEHPVAGDPGNGAGKEGRAELIVLTLLEEEGQPGLFHALTLIDPTTLTGSARTAWDMLGRRLRSKGLELSTAEAASVDTPDASESGESAGEVEAVEEQVEEAPAVAAAPRKSPRRSKKAPAVQEVEAPTAEGQRPVAVPQLVAVGGTAALVEQLEALEGVEVVHVEDGGTRGQALAVLAAVSAALQTPGAVVAIGGPAEMMARLSVRG